MAVIPRDSLGPMLPGVSETSAATQQLVDEEVRRIIETAHEDVTVLLSDHRQQLDSLAHALLDAETLDAVDAYAAAGLPARILNQRDRRQLVTSWHRDHPGYTARSRSATK
jgi:cell division protease FtsH